MNSELIERVARDLYDALDLLVSFLGQKRVRLAKKDLVLGHAREALARALAALPEPSEEIGK